MKITPDFEDARTLAVFANLSPSEAEALRVNYPDFAPQSWWDLETPEKRRRSDGLPSKQWQVTQTRLRAVWNNHFKSLFDVMKVIETIFDPERELFGGNLGPEFNPVFAGLPDDPYPCQNAVLYLMHQPWRAKTCEECHCYIVVGSAKTKYCDKDGCGNSIREIRHRAAKLRSYHKNKKKWKAANQRRTVTLRKGRA